MYVYFSFNTYFNCTEIYLYNYAWIYVYGNNLSFVFSLKRKPSSNFDKLSVWLAEKKTQIHDIIVALRTYR